MYGRDRPISLGRPDVELRVRQTGAKLGARAFPDRIMFSGSSPLANLSATVPLWSEVVTKPSNADIFSATVTALNEDVTDAPQNPYDAVQTVSNIFAVGADHPNSPTWTDAKRSKITNADCIRFLSQARQAQIGTLYVTGELDATAVREAFQTLEGIPTSPLDPSATSVLSGFSSVYPSPQRRPGSFFLPWPPEVVPTARLDPGDIADDAQTPAFQNALITLNFPGPFFGTDDHLAASVLEEHLLATGTEPTTMGRLRQELTAVGASVGTSAFCQTH